MSTLQELDPECIEENGVIETIIIPRSVDIGGFEVHRALPSSLRRMVGPFIFWDQMGPGEFISGKGIDVRPHPHIGLSTVTYLFSGTLDHKDSLGSDMRIAPGDVNLMTAGSGIVHSERTGEDIRQNPSNLFGIQSWLALPKHLEECTPEFAHTEKSVLPEMEYQGVRARVIMGSLFGRSASVETFTDTLYLDVEMQDGGIFEIPRETEERAIYILQGRISLGGRDHDAGQLLVLRPGDEAIVKALGSVRMMVLGGAVADGPRHIWWNFVSSDKERIAQAKEDWRQKKFPTISADQQDFIPLPDSKE